MAAGGHSIGFFKLKRFDLNGNLNGQLVPPIQKYPPLGDIAFHGDNVYMVGGTDTMVWGNQVFTSHGADYADFFIAKLKENELSIVSGINESTSQLDFELYPNPTQQLVHLSLSSGKGAIRVQDITGRVLQSTIFTDQKNHDVDLHDYESGMYFISYNNGIETVTKRILKL